MRTRGQQVEARAAEYLSRLGYQILAQNFQVKGGELDIVALKRDLIFVEVKHRANPRFGSAREMVTKTKQQRLIHSAQVFLAKNPKFQRYPMRFDVICSEGDPQNSPLEWVKDAFRL